MKKHIFQGIGQYHFQFKHLLVLLFILVIFQIAVSIVHKISLQNLLVKTQDWYQRDSAERLANLTATSLELLLETTSRSDWQSPEESQEIIQAFNILLNQPLLQQSVRELCILLPNGEGVQSIDNGAELFQYFFGKNPPLSNPDSVHQRAIDFYRLYGEDVMHNEQIVSIREGTSTFHVLVPFVPKGEIVGIVYVKNTPDFNFITREVISSYDETALIFTALILLGLLAMFYISSYTVKERDEAQEKYFREREERLLEKVHHEKENMFAKRIYHTHHKAEKVMGFIKEDLRQLNADNIETVKYRVSKYANFISRVIYDMKWYDPPVQAIRNPLFRTDLNEVIRFITEHLFLRLSRRMEQFRFELDLDDSLPPVSINEFVIWEIFEPLIQNSIDHSGKENVCIRVSTRYFKENGGSQVVIEDEGRGISEELLQTTARGNKRIFMENITTKENAQNAGYGCYLAYHIATERCGWKMDAENRPEGGSRFIITIPNQE
ncbi:MAG: hypothetical protein Kow0042_05850 [Calditrichia bacterium]